MNQLKQSEREGFKEGAKERELMHRASVTAEQREERLSRRIRDRARRAAFFTRFSIQPFLPKLKKCLSLFD